jgi:hypothetical protein
MKNKGLQKIQIYFWEGMGECKPSTCDFRLEIVRDGEVDYVVGKPSILRKKLKYLELAYKVKLPPVSWKAIVGDDYGSVIYEWERV